MLEGVDDSSLFLERGEGSSLFLERGEGYSLFLERGEGVSLFLEGGEGVLLSEAEDAVEISLIMFKITLELPSSVILAMDSLTNGCYSLNHITVNHFHKMFHIPSLIHILNQTHANEINEFRRPFAFGEGWGFFITNNMHRLQITQLQ